MGHEVIGLAAQFDGNSVPSSTSFFTQDVALRQGIVFLDSLMICGAIQAHRVFDVNPHYHTWSGKKGTLQRYSVCALDFVEDRPPRANLAAAAAAAA